MFMGSMLLKLVHPRTIFAKTLLKYWLMRLLDLDNEIR